MSAKVETTNKIQVVDSEQDPMPAWVSVLNHWNRRKLVVIEIEGGPRVAVRGDLLKRAIDNATNQPMV